MKAVPSPRAVVIPFGVPPPCRGLGLGLAALVHGFTHIDGQSVALAQLLAKEGTGSSPGAVHFDDGPPRVAEHAQGSRPGPVEAFVPPQAWRDLAGGGNAPADVAVVVTGAFEPPNDGRGFIQLLAFDARDGTTRAKVELHLDGAHAGETILAAFDQVWSRVGGDMGLVRDIGDLSWDALESVLRAERCALHDPFRGGPHDRLAAMIHLGRAVGDAPLARFPAGRLATIALEAAMSPASDAKLADAALRALVRAGQDAPDHVELLEATAALHVRLGDASSAEVCAAAAVAMAPNRPRGYLVLSEARRERGDLDAALDAVNAGLSRVKEDVLVNERGVVLAERGDFVGAEAAWRDVIGRDPVNPGAFANLAAFALKRGDSVTAQALIDGALTRPGAHPDVFRRAINLVLGTESDGVARAARLARLAGMMTERVPNDGWAWLMLARAELQLGEKGSAKESLGRVEVLAPGSVLAAEAQRGRFALTEPQVALEVDSVLRAAYTAESADLDAIVARARRFATEHAVWTPWFAVGIAERRRGRWNVAREAFNAALVVAPGCTPAHMELAGAYISLGNHAAALRHAERASSLEGPNPRTLSVLATALLALDRRVEANAAITQALTLDPNDVSNSALAERIRSDPPPPPGRLARFRDALGRLRRPPK